jgi:isoquinoline 1-oxidoreductase beta subunit
MNPMRMNRNSIDGAGAMSRRTFIKTSAAAGAGLTLGLWFGTDAEHALAQTAAAGPPTGASAAGPPGSAFVHIGRDNTVTVIAKHLEMGQGVYTGLPTLVAEELDCAWSQVRVEGAPADNTLYYNTIWKAAFNFPGQGTGGSTAMANSFEQYRQAGATARAMLVAAAAQQWKVPADTIEVKAGVLSASWPMPPHSSRCPHR